MDDKMDMKVSGGHAEGFYDAVYLREHPSNYGGDADDPKWRERIDRLTERTADWLSAVGLADNSEARILEVGCGMAYLNGVHPGWHGLDYSRSAVDRVKERDGAEASIFHGDAQELPFPDHYFDGIYSHAALEHVPDPNRAFEEIDRVLRPGGSALIAPAWNCRPWTVKKLRDRPYAALSIAEKVQKSLIPLRENLIFRAIAALPRRLFGELRLVAVKQIPLSYKPLSPRWDLIEQYGHVSDDDALADIDSHAAMCFFLSRGYELVSHSGFIRRVTARGEGIVVRK